MTNDECMTARPTAFTARSTAFPLRPTAFPARSTAFPLRPTAFPARSTAFPLRPTASFILAQGKAALAAAALGRPAEDTTQPEGLPHRPTQRCPPSPPYEAGLQPAINLSPSFPGPCPGEYAGGLWPPNPLTPTRRRCCDSSCSFLDHWMLEVECWMLNIGNLLCNQGCPIVGLPE